MNVLLDKFESGWIGVAIELTPNEIDLLMIKLAALRSREVGHFHIRSNDFDQLTGVADIGFSLTIHPSDKFSIE